MGSYMFYTKLEKDAYIGYCGDYNAQENQGSENEIKCS
jgi:hypothetical protein